jgi:hypothetical protein
LKSPDRSGNLGVVQHMAQYRRLGVLVAAAIALLSSGCAASGGRSAANRETCDKLVAAVRMAFETGSAWLDPETADFARARGLKDNLSPDPRGVGATFVPRNIPFPLFAAVDPKDGGPRYRAHVASLTPEYNRQLAEEGRRCEW